MVLLGLNNTGLINQAIAEVDYQNSKAFSHPDENLNGEARLNFMVGRGLFRRLWVTAPASTQAVDGLGPLYNARSCMGCHTNNGRGHGPTGTEDDVGLLLLRLDIPAQNAKQQLQLEKFQINNVPEPNYGLQMQNFAIPGHLAEYQLFVEYENILVALSDGTKVSLRKPSYVATALAYGSLHHDVRISPRVPPQMIGLGLLEAIDDQDIFKQEDPLDKDKDGISGRANIVWSKEYSKTALGRFGHKAGMPSINEQVQSAFSIDLGLSVPLFKNAAGDCTSQQTQCLAAPNGNSVQYDNLEADQQVVDLVNLYVNHLAVPPQRNRRNSNVQKGEKVFNQIGCNKCHTPHYVTGTGTTAKLNHAKNIFPYTDLLLHDMGAGLADNRPEGRATGTEWRTAPLWGIGLTKQVSGYNHYLHDGRARSLLEAILWHGGEAESQRDAVIALDRIAREQLLKFIESL